MSRDGVNCFSATGPVIFRDWESSGDLRFRIECDRPVLLSQFLSLSLAGPVNWPFEMIGRRLPKFGIAPFRHFESKRGFLDLRNVSLHHRSPMSAMAAGLELIAVPSEKRDVIIWWRGVMCRVAAEALFFTLSVCIVMPTALARQSTQPPKVFVTTTNDDRLSGRLIEVTAERIGIETSYAGRVNIRAIELKEWAAEDTAACQRLTSVFPARMKAGSCTKALPSPPVASTAKEPVEWQRTIDFAYAAARGNVNTTDLNAALNLSHKKGNRRIAFSIFGRRSVSSNAAVTNLLISTLRFEKAVWEQPGFSETTVEIDRVKQIGYRISNNVGLTYPLLSGASSQLSFDLGTGLTHEIFRTGLGRTGASSLLRISAAQQLDDRAELTQRITLMPDLLAPEAFRLQTDVALTMPVTKHLALRLAGLNRFESQPQGTAKRNDFSLLTGLKFNF